ASWKFDTQFPTISGAPVPASNLRVTGTAATWANNEPKAADVYLDYATDVAFTQSVATQILAPGTTSTTVLVPSKFYRVRTVNANGTSLSGVFPSAATLLGSSGTLGSAMSLCQNNVTRFNQLKFVPVPTLYAAVGSDLYVVVNNIYD